MTMQTNSFFEKWKESSKLVIISASFLIQLVLSFANISIVFLDASPGLAELALFSVLILFVHGTAIYALQRKSKPISLVVSLVGFFLVGFILFLQNFVGGNWFVTGIGGVGIIGAFHPMLWHAVITLLTLILLKKKRVRFKTLIKRLLLFLIPTWFLLIFLGISVFPFVLTRRQSLIDIQDLLQFFSQLLGLPFILLLLPQVAGVMIGITALILLSAYFVKQPRYLGKVFLSLLFVTTFIACFVNKPFQEAQMQAFHPVWNYEDLPVYEFELSNTPLKAPCPVKPVITDTSFNCKTGLLKIEAVSDDGSAYALARTGKSIAVPEKPKTKYLNVSPFNDIGIYYDDNSCATAMPRVAFESVRLDFSSTVCEYKISDTGYTVDDWEDLALPLFSQISFPDNGYVSAY